MRPSSAEARAEYKRLVKTERLYLKAAEASGNKALAQKLRVMLKEMEDEGQVLFYDKKRGSDLSVIAQRSRLGNITEASLNDSIARFKRFVNEFKQKTKSIIPASVLRRGRYISESEKKLLLEYSGY